MNNIPKDQVYWHTLKKPICQKLVTDITTDVVVIGGGMAGLTCAQTLSREGVKVVILEKEFCGSGATGKSSGFITPDSELEIHDLISLYKSDIAKKLWEFSVSGVHLIKKNIESYKIECDYIKQDALFTANNKSQLKTIKDEYNKRRSIELNTKFYGKTEIQDILGSDKYLGGMRFTDTFGINAYLYCQEMKAVLARKGVSIYEKSPVTKVSSGFVESRGGNVFCKKVVICVDRVLPEFHIASKEIYHAQTFLMISKPLSDTAIKQIFPHEALMVWDADLIYQYFRVTSENRILLGGGNVFYTYLPWEKHNSLSVYSKLKNYFSNKFPEVEILWDYMWPGLIGVSRDFLPIAGQDKEKENIYFISAVAGLPWAAALGNYIAEKIVHERRDLDIYFSPTRNFKLPSELEYIISKPLIFALSHGIEKI